MICLAVTILLIVGILAVGYILFDDEDDRDDTWRGF